MNRCVGDCPEKVASRTLIVSFHSDMPNETTKPHALIGEVLNQNLEVADQLKATANELNVVHVVLSTKIPPTVLDGDLQAAVNRTDELEQQLSDTADALKKSNELLREIDANLSSESETATKPSQETR